VVTTHVKRAFKYRFYPTPEQAGELTRTFGCVSTFANLMIAIDLDFGCAAAMVIWPT
jgi:putative transposase